jgi:hypothetical protein
MVEFTKPVKHLSGYQLESCCSAGSSGLHLSIPVICITRGQGSAMALLASSAKLHMDNMDPTGARG